jgi:hypothetical protein
MTQMPDVVEMAEEAAAFFRTLVNEGVPPPHAVSIAGNFVTARTLALSSHIEPGGPWDEGYLESIDEGDEWKHEAPHVPGEEEEEG